MKVGENAGHFCIIVFFFFFPPSATNANREDFIFLPVDLHPRKVVFILAYYVLKAASLVFTESIHSGCAYSPRV